MDTFNYVIRKIIYSIPILFGVTLISFTLMVYMGPDLTYSILGKNATQEEITEIRHELGYDQSFPVRYFGFLREIVTFDFGNSLSTGKKVSTILKDTVPVTFALSFPGFILANALGIGLALLAGYYRGGYIDKFIMVGAVIGMSISFLIVVIAFQVIFCTEVGLDMFPVQGWSMESLQAYLYHLTVPMLCEVFVALGYNTRFFRAVIVEEMNRDYVRTAKAYGCSPAKLLFKHVLKNSMIPIMTRIIITIPFILIAGSLVLERYFNIPGIGLITFDAITTGDLPIIKAVVTLTAILYVSALIITDISYKLVDPRISYR